MTNRSRIFVGYLSAILLAGSGVVAAAEPAPGAAPAISKEASHATRLILLGTAGGSAVSLMRSEPASLLVVHGKPYLIDVGAGVTYQLVKAGYQPASVHQIFITHHHADHDAGLEPLMSLQWSRRGLEALDSVPVDIYGPPATRFMVHAILDSIGVTERIWHAGVDQLRPAAPMFQAHDIDQDGIVYRDDLVRVTAVENTHFSFPSSGPSGIPSNFEQERKRSAEASHCSGICVPLRRRTRSRSGALSSSFITSWSSPLSASGPTKRRALRRRSPHDVERRAALARRHAATMVYRHLIDSE